MKKTIKTEVPPYVNPDDVLLYICNYKKKIADGKCSGAACKFLKNGDCERTEHFEYAKNKFDFRNFEFLGHFQREGMYDYDVYIERNSKGETI